jgi:predicted ribosome-associated RNA-binding protein Tma20
MCDGAEILNPGIIYVEGEPKRHCERELAVVATSSGYFL